MKKYFEILAEIDETRATITNTAETEKELDWLALRNAIDSKSDPAEILEARAKYKAAEARYIDELARNESAKIALEILKDNAAQALAAEILPTICEIWNKYEKKPHGEKTADKIRAELRAATGYRVYISNKWDDAQITIYFDCGIRAPWRSLEFVPVWNGSKQPATDSNNKIVRISAEAMRVHCCGAYVDDVPAHVDALREAHRAAKEAEKALENAVSAYNALTRGSIARGNTREGVKNWMI